MGGVSGFKNASKAGPSADFASVLGKIKQVKEITRKET